MPVAEVVPVRLREVVDLVRADVHAAGGDLVQLRLPDVRAVLSISVTSRAAARPSLSPSRGGELEPAGAAADDDDAVALRCGHADPLPARRC